MNASGMSSLQPDQDARVARSVVYLLASVLLILAFSVVGLFLEAELKNQQSLGGASEPVATEQRSLPSVDSEERRPSWWFKGRHASDAGRGSGEPTNQNS